MKTTWFFKRKDCFCRDGDPVQIRWKRAGECRQTLSLDREMEHGSGRITIRWCGLIVYPGGVKAQDNRQRSSGWRKKLKREASVHMRDKRVQVQHLTPMDVASWPLSHGAALERGS